MRISSGNIDIIKLGEVYIVSENLIKPGGAMGEFQTLQEAIETCIERTKIPKLKSDLEELHSKCTAADWDEGEIFDADSN